MQKKIFAYTMAVLLITLMVSGFFTARSIEKIYYDNIEDKLVSQAYIMSRVLGGDLQNRNLQHIQQISNDIGKKLHVRITVIDNAGKVLGDSSYDANHMENHLNRPEVQQALKGEQGKQRRYSTTMKVDYLYIAEPIYNNELIAGVVRLSTPLYEINGIMHHINDNILLALIPGLLLSLLLIYSISRGITRPIKELKNAAVEITTGKLNPQINIMRKDEIGELAKAIDFMAASLRDKINSIKDKSVKMEAILSSVANGIIAVDGNQEILFINPMAQELLSIPDGDISGKHLLEVIRHSKIDNMIRSILEDSSIEETEMSLTYPREKVFKLYSNVIKYPDSDRIIGIIIIIQDITEIRRLERMRSEFVANVSHELKTPLTSIKGFVETLKAGALEDEEASVRFLNIIEEEADRLNRLISDILSLSELESKNPKMRLETIYTAEKISDIISMLRHQADKKHISLQQQFNEDLMRLKGDPDQFKQMLLNLIDNAIKYTPDGGCVEVKAYNEQGNVVISIKDNGIGIPPEHIPRLFERFYRVDKARSRKVGGTGLGLAIVKHIVMQFEGKIDVHSEIGKGTEFVLTLPAKA